VRGTEAVRAGVAAADDDDLFALGTDGRLGVVTLLHAVGRGQELHGLVDAFEFATLDGEIAPHGGSAGEHDGIELCPKILGRNVDTDVDSGAEDRALSFHLRQTAIDVPLLHLELGDAVAEQAADAIGAFEDGDGVPGTRELLRRSESRGPGADDRDGLAGQVRRVDGCDPAFLERVVDDLDFHLLDGHRILVDAKHARGLARRRAQPPGELREVVGRVQAVDAFTPPVLVDQVVPLRDEVSQRAAVVAERDSTIHASAGLRLEGVLREVLVDLFPVHQAQVDGSPLGQLAHGVLQKSLWVTHELPP